EREPDRTEHEHDLQGTLQEMEIGQPLRVVLLPVPDRKRRVATELESDRPVVEDAQSMERRRVEEDDDEDDARRDDERGDEADRPPAAPRLRIARPQRHE